ncbi:MAG: SIMPL domain-containing protein [Armatimonadia bacterium]
MRTRMLVVAGLLALTAVGAWAQGGKIRVLGQGEVFTAPDTAEASFSVRAEDKQLPAAREKAAAQMTRVLDALKALKLPGLTLSTTSISVTPLVKPQQGGYVGPDAEARREVVGYQVTSTVNARLEGEPAVLSQGMSKIMDTAVANGATTFFGPNIYRRNLDEPNRQALAAATKDAVAKAQALATAAGVTIKGYSYIGMYPEDQPNQPPMPVFEARTMAMGGGGAPTPTPVEVRDISVTAQVWVTAVY